MKKQIEKNIQRLEYLAGHANSMRNIVSRFNIDYPVGSEISYWSNLGLTTKGKVYRNNLRNTKVREKAFLHGKNLRPMVFVQGMNGCVSIDCVGKPKRK